MPVCTRVKWKGLALIGQHLEFALVREPLRVKHKVGTAREALRRLASTEAQNCLVERHRAGRASCIDSKAWPLQVKLV